GPSRAHAEGLYAERPAELLGQLLGIAGCASLQKPARRLVDRAHHGPTVDGGIDARQRRISVLLGVADLRLGQTFEFGVQPVTHGLDRRRQPNRFHEQQPSYPGATGARIDESLDAEPSALTVVFAQARGTSDHSYQGASLLLQQHPEAVLFRLKVLIERR